MDLQLQTFGPFLDTMPDAAVLVDERACILFANASADQMFGHPVGSLRGQPLSVLLPVAQRGSHEAMVRQYFGGPHVRPMGTDHRFVALRRDGREIAVDIMLKPLVVDGRPATLAVVRDITERRRVERALQEALERERQRAHTDHLTGASNARHFAEVAQREIDRLQRYHQPFTLCYIDLDNFKGVNDSLGHSVGDQVLCAVTATIASHLRATDLLARLGGDEFALLLPQTEQAGALATMDKLRQEVATRMAASGWPVTLSVGLLTCHRAPASVDDLLREVDRLMYSAKGGGKDRVWCGVHD